MDGPRVQMIFVFLIYFYYLQLLLHILYFAAGCPLSYRQLRAANGKNPVLWYKNGKILWFKTFPPIIISAGIQ
ncbi:MAG: hypothetical protein BHW28_06510 [Faecalibacterium prausnitzii]|nr:MAG: hypothetical protein BHW28_06510 [Faecalibacterium prausnitzii]